MSYIRKQEYADERIRPKLLTNYLEQMVKYLQLKHPNKSHAEIEHFVKSVIVERAKSPMVEAIVHKREGESEIVTKRLDHYIRDVIADNNLAPSGTCYHPVSRKESFLRMSIEGKIKARNDFKKLYLDYEAQGKKRESQYFYQNQANAKIFNNAIAGGMNITQFILGCKAGFNAITSTGRISVKQGYSFIERAVNGNIYLPSMKDAITYALNHARHMPKDFAALIESNTLYIPSVQDVSSYLASSVHNYTTKVDETDLLAILDRMTIPERSYVFYAGCLNNLCRYNESIMRSWIDSCFLPEDIDSTLYQHIDLGDVKKIPGDVISCVLSTNYKRLGLKSKDDNKWNSVKDAAIKNPDGLKAFIYCCQHFVENFTKLLPILIPILRIETTFAKLVFQHRMARYTVPLSDTDSNIFSTQELVRWKRGKLDFSQESYEMNAIVTFILSQSLEHVFARLSAGLGAEGKDVFSISMKNEFLYPIIIVTAVAKHYLAIATMQEGSLLPHPRKDIKGVGFKSSAYPKTITKGFETYVVNLFATIEKAEPIRASSVLAHVANLEHTIHKSLKNRESEYLQTVSIRQKQDYADPDKSSYFYYEFWQSVFAPDYGEMVIPNKCFKIPLRGEKKFFKNLEELNKIKEEQPALYNRLMAFMERYPKRDITAILIPPFKGSIHPFFLGIMDARSHISQVLRGYYLFMDALGVGTINYGDGGLVSDFFDPTSALLE